MSASGLQLRTESDKMRIRGAPAPGRALRKTAKAVLSAPNNGKGTIRIWPINPGETAERGQDHGKKRAIICEKKYPKGTGAKAPGRFPPRVRPARENRKAGVLTEPQGLRVHSVRYGRRALRQSGTRTPRRRWGVRLPFRCCATYGRKALLFPRRLISIFPSTAFRRSKNASVPT